VSAAASLRGWQALLARFPEELHEALLPWLQRLDLAVGPLAAEDPRADGDPDGFLGLSRRGPYERLLLSEWLLASELPDEFLRRAAAGEHAFLELARRSEAGSRVTAALFDAGPWQLGAPRLAHLALLMVLERRALLAGAAFFWGVLQQPGLLRESVAPDQAMQLLHGRSRRDVDRSMIDDFLATPALREARRELWIIGGASACALAPGPCIEVREPLSVDPSPLEVHLRRADRSSLLISLPLPPEQQQLRLLRDPFERPPVVRKSRRALAGGELGSLFFSDNGRRLFLGLKEGGVIAYPVPNSPYMATPGEPTILRTVAGEGKQVVAVGWEKNQGVLLLKEGPSFWLRTVGRKGGVARKDQRIDGEALVWSGGPPVPLHSVVVPRGARGHALLTPEGQYAFIDFAGNVRTRPDVRAAAQINHQLVLAHQAPMSRDLLFELETGDESAAPRFLAASLSDVSGGIHFGYAEGSVRHPELMLCGVERRDVDDWALLCRHEHLSHLPISVPAGEQVVGVYHAPPGPVLLALSRDRRELWGYGAQAPVRLAGAASPLVAVATSQVGPVFAYTTEQQELVIFSHRFSQPLLRVTHGKP
jgi:hypothetical protein